jgi:hypothetical protein
LFYFPAGLRLLIRRFRHKHASRTVV